MSVCKISGKMKLATTFLWWLFDMRKANKRFLIIGYSKKSVKNVRNFLFVFSLVS